MHLIFLLVGVFIVIVFIEVPGIVREKDRRQLAVYSFFLLLALVLSLLLTIGVKIPSPMKGIQYVIKDILHWNYK